MATIPPYLYYIGERGDGYDVAAALFDPDCMWIVRPQLFFHCTLRPIGATVPGRLLIGGIVQTKTFSSTWFFERL